MFSNSIKLLIALFVLLFLLLVSPLLSEGAPLGTSMKDFVSDPGVQDVYKECRNNNWPIVARIGTVRQPDPQQPNKTVLYLFVKNNTLNINAEYFRTSQGRYVVLLAFPASVVDKSLSDFIKK